MVRHLAILQETCSSPSAQLACPIKEKYCGDDFDMIHNAAGALRGIHSVASALTVSATVADGRLNMRSVKLFALVN